MRRPLPISFFLLIVLYSPVLYLAPPFGNDVSGDRIPVVDSTLKLVDVGRVEDNPAVLRLTIPWTSGEPEITNISYSVSGGGWIVLQGWEGLLHSGLNETWITFPVNLSWGVTEVVNVNVTDRMGSNSTVGTEVIRSRPPTVKIVPLEIVDHSPSPAEKSFEVQASDPDGQNLSFTWIVDGIPASYGQYFTGCFPPGNHSLEVQVTDGQWEVNDTYVLSIEHPVETERKGPDLFLMGSISIMVLSLFLLILFFIHILIDRSRELARERMEKSSGRGSLFGEGALVCEICLKDLRQGQSITRCRCGAYFHRGCGRREGVCPVCGREILI